MGILQSAAISATAHEVLELIQKELDAAKANPSVRKVMERLREAVEEIERNSMYE